MSKFIILIAAMGCWTAYADPVLTLDPPGGALTGFAGETVGWGFTVTNDTSFFLLFDGSYFCQAGQDPQFTTCTQNLGTYEDAIAANVTEIAPLSFVTQAFSADLTTGFGAYVIDPAALAGSVDSGNLVATYMEFNGDPLDGGTQVSGDIEISAAGSVTVTALPEPASWLMLAGGLGCLSLLKRRRVRKSKC